MMRSFILPLINYQKIFLALGNERPQILIQLEDFVLLAIVGLSEGRGRDIVMDSLYSQILSLENDLASNEDALSWFNIATGDLATGEFETPLSPAAPLFVPLPNVLGAGASLQKDVFLGMF
jgi:hypothetical protein